jgi:DNA-binding MarR family transcriptional regulator
MPDYPPLSTRVIGETESALGALLVPLLAEAGLSFLQWVVLSLTTGASTAGPGAPASTREQLIDRIANARKVDPADVAAAVSDLEAAAALRCAADGTVTLTEAGRASHARLLGRLDEITSYLFDLPAEDLAVAGRVLATVTARANSVLAGQGMP